MLFLQLSLFAAVAQHRVFLLHPTVENIENMLSLIQQKVIEIPDLEMVGVYYEKEVFDYSKSEKYLKDHQIANYTLMKISGELNTRNIYQENDCIPAATSPGEFFIPSKLLPKDTSTTFVCIWSSKSLTF
ncbi:MAG: hypothetical protein M1292_10200 [Bacteroidetes bacterium]|nr:hypothetical protein [Bacteroidota bacterium]